MIKRILQNFISNIAGLVIAAFFLSGFVLQMDILTICTVAGALTLVNMFIRPIIKVISFPINAVTLGVFGWFINAILLFFVVYVLDGIEITGGDLILDFLGPLTLTVPNIYLQDFMTLIAASFIISFVNWLLKKILF